MALEGKYRFSEGVAFRVVDGTVVVVDPKTNKIITLNEVASDVWQNLENRPLAEVIDYVIEKYAVEPDAARKDILFFMESVEKRGLVSVAS